MQPNKKEERESKAIILGRSREELRGQGTKRGRVISEEESSDMKEEREELSLEV